MRLLNDVEALEQAGVVVRMPASWRAGRPSRPWVEATVGSNAPSVVGASSLLDFQLEVTLDGEPLTPKEIARLVDSADGLAMLRGKWVEVDPMHLKATLDRFKPVERLARKGASRSGRRCACWRGRISTAKRGRGRSLQWEQATAGPWLAETLKNCRSPMSLPPPVLATT